MGDRRGAGTIDRGMVKGRRPMVREFRQHHPQELRPDDSPGLQKPRCTTKQEIDSMVAEKGFRDNWQGQGVNYISERLALEDMHPANVFIDELTGKPTCIDCIVKFLNSK